MPILPFRVDVLILSGTLGILLGLVFLMVFSGRRLKFMAKRLARKPASVPGAVASTRNFLLILLWTAVFCALFFAGFFFQAYHTFTREDPVAQLTITPLPQEQESLITLELFSQEGEKRIRQYRVSGDQWVMEGDVLKWKTWLNFLGLHTRYRLTRLRGRYIRTADAKLKPSSIHSLVEMEDHPVWGFLYRNGSSFPLVDAVYGSAVFQGSDEPSTFLVYVSTSGFLTRRIEN
jgi:hypothetical protein